MTMQQDRRFRHPLAMAILGAIAGVFDRQMARLTGPGVLRPPAEVDYYGVPDSRRHNRGGTAAAKRAARKRRNVVKNRRAHRG